MAPAFLFVNPYGFKIPAGLRADLMKAGRVELFINIMWRELDMLIQHPAEGSERGKPGSEARETEDVTPRQGNREGPSNEPPTLIGMSCVEENSGQNPTIPIGSKR